MHSVLNAAPVRKTGRELESNYSLVSKILNTNHPKVEKAKVEKAKEKEERIITAAAIMLTGRECSPEEERKRALEGKGKSAT